MAFLGSFGDFGQSQMLTRVRQSITIQNNKIADLKSRINEINRLRNFTVDSLVGSYYSVGQNIILKREGFSPL